MKSLILGLLCLACAASQAADLQVPYTVIRKDTAGEPLTGKISLVLYYGKDPDVLYRSVLVSLPAAGDFIIGSYTIPGLEAGTWYVSGQVLSEDHGDSFKAAIARLEAGTLPRVPMAPTRLEAK